MIETPIQTDDAPSALLVGTMIQRKRTPRHRILLVDDDLTIRRLYAVALNRSGYEVDASADGADAWHALNLDNYDLLITDNNMPNVTGVELLKKVREARMNIPVIMATGRLPEEEFARNPSIKPAATILKPYTISVLLQTVKEVLRATDGIRR